MEMNNRTKAGLLVLVLFVFGFILSAIVREKNLREIREDQSTYE